MYFILATSKYIKFHGHISALCHNNQYVIVILSTFSLAPCFWVYLLSSVSFVNYFASMVSLFFFKMYIFNYLWHVLWFICTQNKLIKLWIRIHHSKCSLFIKRKQWTLSPESCWPVWLTWTGRPRTKCECVHPDFPWRSCRCWRAWPGRRSS